MEMEMFKPKNTVVIENDESYFAFVSDFLENYLGNDDIKRKVKESYDQDCKQSIERGEGKDVQYSPAVIIERCLVNFTDLNSGLFSIHIAEQISKAGDSKETSTTGDSKEVSKAGDSKEISTTADSKEISTTADSKEISTTADSKEISKAADSKEISTTADSNIINIREKLKTNSIGLLTLSLHRHLYHRLCSTLGIKVAVGISMLSPEPILPAADLRLETSGRCFVPRGGLEHEGINEGLKKDRKSFMKFMDLYPNRWCSSIFDDHINTSLPQGNMISKQQLLEHFKGESLRYLRPVGSEVVMYFAGHGEKNTGDWGAYAMNEKKEVVQSLYITLEDILDAWKTSEEWNKEHFHDEYLHLTIISDCCYSNTWVRKLKEDIEKGSDSKYAQYPISIQGAASVCAYEQTLLPLLTAEAQPSYPGQDPNFVCTPAYKASSWFRCWLEESDVTGYKALYKRDGALSRGNLSEASGKVSKACENIIQKWTLDSLDGIKQGTVITHDDPIQIRIDKQGSSGEKSAFCNLQIQACSESYAQVHVQYNFNPGHLTIRKYLKKSVKKGKAYWIYNDHNSNCPKCHKGDSRPNANMDKSILLVASENKKKQWINRIHNEWNVESLRKITPEHEVFTLDDACIVWVKPKTGKGFTFQLRDTTSGAPFAQVMVRNNVRPDKEDIFMEIKKALTTSLEEEIKHTYTYTNRLELDA